MYGNGMFSFDNAPGNTIFIKIPFGIVQIVYMAYCINMVTIE